MSHSVFVRNAQLVDAVQLAKLHKVEINQGFLSTLNLKFLTLLYRHLISTGSVFVAMHESDDYIVGFVAGVNNTKKFYLSFLLSKGFIAAPLLLGKVFNLSFVRKVFESLLVPFKKAPPATKQSSERLPELVSIAVSSSTKGLGVGGQLIQKLEEGYKKSGVTKYTVVVGDKLLLANKFYQKHGFIKSHVIVVHGDEKSNVYTKHIATE